MYQRKKHFSNRLVRLMQVCILLCLNNVAFAVDVNLANRAQLEATRGIGISMAERILVERAAHGLFKSWDDFAARIKGVGDKNLKTMQKDGLTLESK